MFVKKALYDEWKGSIDYGGMVEVLSLDTAEGLIHSLDGLKHTQVIFTDEEDSLICIGGGNEGFYNVYITLDDNESFYDLINPNGRSDKVLQLITGGQIGDFEEDICVTLDKVLLAAKTFCIEGVVEKDLTWNYRT